jgi:transcriptional regulator with XRE-family HTH domain
LVETLISWLSTELNNRGWSQRELARRAQISHTSITEVLSQIRQPTFDFLAAIATPLSKTPLEMFILAEKMPAEPEPADKYHLRALIAKGLARSVEAGNRPPVILNRIGSGNPLIKEDKVNYTVDDIGREIGELAARLGPIKLTAWLDFGRYLADLDETAWSLPPELSEIELKQD